MRDLKLLFSFYVVLFPSLFFFSCESERYWSNPHDPNTDLLPEEWRPKNLIILNNSDNELTIYWEYERENIGGFQLESKKNNEDWEVVNAFIDKSLRESIVQFNGTPLDSMDIDFRIMAYAGSNQSAYDTTIISENAVKIVSVDYDLDLMLISWEEYQLNDFDYYQILSSDDILGVKTIVDTIKQIDITSLLIDEYNPLKENWFWSRTVTKTGKGFIGEGRTNIIETTPNSVDIVSVEYDLTKMIVTWEMSDDWDFASYDLLDPENQTLKFTTSKYDTIYITNDFDPLKENWFQIKVTDYWGLDSTGEAMANDIDEPPNSINIISIEYQISPLQMTISWESSQDWDFSSYRVQYSDTEAGERTNIVTLSDINTNLFEILEFDPTIERWYWLVTTDHWGQSTNSDGYMVYDGPPSQGVLYPINYEDDSLFITWQQNQDQDFSKYILYESWSTYMDESTEIYSTNNRSDTTFTVSGINSEDNRYYQLVYEDIWGSQTLTDIKAGVPYVHFIKTFGGENEDVGYSVQQTTDGGYIIVGYTNSYGSGSYDVLLLKTDSDGNELWMQTYGEGYDDKGYSIETVDDGFVIAGYTYSFNSNSYDMLLIKTNMFGDVLWSRTYGGTGTDKGYSVQKTFNPDGFIVTGYSEAESTGFDMFLVKTDPEGNQEWSKTYGSTGIDKGYSVQQTSDGGFILSGVTTGEFGFDVRVIKTYPNGDVDWNKVFGNTLNDIGFSVDQTDDGFIVVGYTEIFGSGDEDILLLKINNDGNQGWERTFGGNGIDHGYTVNMIDGGFMIIGFTESFGAGNKDVWLIKTNTNGNQEWERTFGGNNIDHGYSVEETDDDGFIITGYTKSENNNVDLLLIKDHPIRIP